MSDSSRSGDFADFELQQDDEQWHAVGHDMVVSVDKGNDKPMCHQRALKKHLKNGGCTHDSVLRCELDDVKVYIKPGHIVITKKALHL